MSLVLCALLLISACAAAPDRPPESAEMDRAVALALERTVDARSEHGPYRLMSAQRFPLKDGWIWRVTVKPEHLLPADPSRGLIGAGGELFVNVDLTTNETTLGYGE